MTLLKIDGTAAAVQTVREGAAGAARASTPRSIGGRQANRSPRPNEKAEGLAD